MRTIHRQAGWRVAIAARDHGIPHFHVIFSDGTSCAVSIDTLKVLAGAVLPRKVAPAIEWAEDQKATLLKVWKEMNP